jgi:hypothetical protein
MVNSQPIGLTEGVRGDVWFAENVGNKIGRLLELGETRKGGDPRAVRPNPFGY